MRVKDIVSVISSATSVDIVESESRRDALNGDGNSVQWCHSVEDIKPEYADRHICYIYPYRKDELMVFIVKGNKIDE